MREACVWGLLVLGAACALAAGVVPGNIEAPEDCIVALNLIRTTGVNHPLSVLEKHPEVEAQLTHTLDEFIGEARSCEGLPQVDIDWFKYPVAQWWFQGDLPNCKELMQEDLKRFLATAKSYPPTLIPEIPWNNTAGANASVVLSQKGRYVGCRMTEGCDKNLLLCEAMPRTNFRETVFSPEFYTDMLQREKAGVDISKMTKANINVPSQRANSGGGGNASSGATTPGYASGVWVLATAVGASLAQIR